MLNEEEAEVDRRPLLIGADHHGPLEVSLAGLRAATAMANDWCNELGYGAGDSLLLVRLPHSSEVPLATAAIALMSLGLRVVLPMSFDLASLVQMVREADCRALLKCDDLVAHTDDGQVQRANAMFGAVADAVGISTYSLDGELNWHVAPIPDDEPLSFADDSFEAPEREVLVLSTSGSTGQPKLARYTDLALLRVAEAWNVAGLMAESVTGGRSLCPALSHSMGFRNVVHAIWNRQPTLLAQTELLEEKPKKYVRLLERCTPQHITCGPAYLGDLGLLASSVERVRTALSSLQTIVSSGAAAVDVQRLLPPETRVANAFGMTELQQVLNTLLCESQAVRGALGCPLPGVTVGVRYVDAEQQLGRLFVSAPFASRGYLGQADFGEWFETGDLVRVVGDNLVWIGRGEEDFLNTGQGVKVSLAELDGNYQNLHRAAEAMVFTALPSRGGIGALVYVGNHDPEDAEVHRQILAATAADHRLMADASRDFALEYTTVSVVGCVAGRPPRRGPGKIDRQAAIEREAELIHAMADFSGDHPQTFNVAPSGSDKPDWRRFATR